jgi:hypothetical protein
LCFLGGKIQGSSALRALVQYTLRDNPNKVVKFPHHTENMQARGIRIQRQHKEEGDKEKEKRENEKVRDEESTRKWGTKRAWGSERQREHKERK